MLPISINRVSLLIKICHVDSLLLYMTENTYCQPLLWMLCMKIVLGSAKGLEFLHSDEAQVIFGYLKTLSVLLDSVSKPHLDLLC